MPPKKQKGSTHQKQQFVFDEGKGLSSQEQQYDLTPIINELRSLIETFRRHVATTANLVPVNLYWTMGRIIAEDIQKNKKRAGYGKQLIQELPEVLRKEYGKGFTQVNLQDMMRFFESFSICQALLDKCEVYGKSQAVPDKFGFSSIIEDCAAWLPSILSWEHLQKHATNAPNTPKSNWHIH
jgi:hypothetical protein